MIEVPGYFNMQDLADAASKPREFLVDGLLFAGSVNLAVGDSGLGKTALLISLGIAVAEGLPWLGKPTTQGPVLFVDGESPLAEFHGMVKQLSAFAGFAEAPENFHAFNPYWDEHGGEADALVGLKKLVMTLQPKLVIVDPMRVFWPQAESKSEDALKMIQYQRELSSKTGSTWVTLHHRRKTNALNKVDLTENPQAWFQEAAGSRALVNQTDSRIGIDQSPLTDIVVGGFTRIVGAIAPVHLTRHYDDDGKAIGYQPLKGFEFLPERFVEAFRKLGDEFRHRDAVNALGGNSRSSVSEFLSELQSRGLVEKTEKGYRKLSQEKPRLLRAA